jgi:CheY-like chemotaxis protein
MGHPLRILSIEDDPRDTKLIQELLETEGVVCEVRRVDTQNIQTDRGDACTRRTPCRLPEGMITRIVCG